MLIASTDCWLLSSVSTPWFVFICCLESYRTMIVRWCGCGVTRFAELGWLKRREKHRSRSELVWRQWRYHGCWALSSVLQCSVLSAQCAQLRRPVQTEERCRRSKNGPTHSSPHRPRATVSSSYLAPILIITSPAQRGATSGKLAVSLSYITV